ncbi:hypothetical protein HMPREF0972_01886 [Actinomyces sp. oral taxon 848 str. F0332]|nr:hypothetical protein HMPREF0972_01886 [Actinomyces sp. oral taxon 848 str. F0332]
MHFEGLRLDARRASPFGFGRSTSNASSPPNARRAQNACEVGCCEGDETRAGGNS